MLMGTDKLRKAVGFLVTMNRFFMFLDTNHFKNNFKNNTGFSELRKDIRKDDIIPSLPTGISLPQSLTDRSNCIILHTSERVGKVQTARAPPFEFPVGSTNEAR